MVLTINSEGGPQEHLFIYSYQVGMTILWISLNCRGWVGGEEAKVYRPRPSESFGLEPQLSHSTAAMERTKTFWRHTYFPLGIKSQEFKVWNLITLLYFVRAMTYRGGCALWKIACMGSNLRALIGRDYIFLMHQNAKGRKYSCEYTVYELFLKDL